MSRWSPVCLFLPLAAAVFATSPVDRGGGAAGRRTEFLAQIERPRVAPAPELVPGGVVNGLRREHLTLSTEATVRLGATIYTRVEETPSRRGAVVLLHHTGDGGESMRKFAEALAKRGLIAVALDARGYGRTAGPDGGRETYMRALERAAVHGEGQPFLFDPVWDAMRLIDYLCSRDDIDSARIGLLGNSKGGMEAVLLAAVDERVRATVPLIGVQSFRYAVEHDAWRGRIDALQPAVARAAAQLGVAEVDAAFARRFFNAVAPGLVDRFDTPEVLPLVAPRGLLVINGETDPRNPWRGVERCLGAAREAYARAGAADEFESIVEPDVGHTITAPAAERAIAWLTAKLSP